MCYINISDSTKVVYIYDDDDYEDDDFYSKDKNSYKKKKYPKDNSFLIKASAYSSKVNTILGLLVLSGLLLLPMAIAAELDLNAISQQISILQGVLTDYYVALLQNTQSIIATLATITTTLTTISTTVASLASVPTTLTAIQTTLATQATTLQTIITLLNTIING